MRTPLLWTALCLAVTLAIPAQTISAAENTQPGVTPDKIALDMLALRQAARLATIEAIAHWRAVLDDPDADLRAEIASTQTQVDAFIAEFRELRDARLDWYESLSPEQQAVARDQLRRRLDRVERLVQLLGAFAPSNELY